MSSFSGNPFAILDDEPVAPVAAPVVSLSSAALKSQSGSQQAQKPARKPVVGANNNQTISKSQTTKTPVGSTPAGASGNTDAVRDGGHRRDGQRSRRGQRGGWTGRGREFDRHSGAPKDSEKKVHSGWGDAPEDAVKAEALSGVDPVQGDLIVGADGNTPSVQPAEPELPVKTLDEYLAEKKAATLVNKKPAAPVRKANEGADNSKWSKAVPFQREEVEEFSVGKEAAKKKAKEAKAKQTVDINVRFVEKEREQSSRGGRGGRGGSRGGNAGARGGRGGSKANAPNLKDSSAFPILAK
eukprot:Partr_v1_DN28731_c1_g1_i4_m62216 putative NA